MSSVSNLRLEGLGSWLGLARDFKPLTNVRVQRASIISLNGLVEGLILFHRDRYGVHEKDASHSRTRYPLRFSDGHYPTEVDEVALYRMGGVRELVRGLLEMMGRWVVDG